MENQKLCKFCKFPLIDTKLTISVGNSNIRKKLFECSNPDKLDCANKMPIKGETK